MGGLLFVGQAMLESWVEQGKIAFSGNTMTLHQGSGAGRSYVLDPAVRFLRVVGADEDPHALTAKVKTDAQLRALGAERMGDSVLVGEVAYEVQPGFIAHSNAPAGQDDGKRGDAAQWLARFLLENLR